MKTNRCHWPRNAAPAYRDFRHCERVREGSTEKQLFDSERHDELRYKWMTFRCLSLSEPSFCDENKWLCGFRFRLGVLNMRWARGGAEFTSDRICWIRLATQQTSTLDTSQGDVGFTFPPLSLSLCLLYVLRKKVLARLKNTFVDATKSWGYWTVLDLGRPLAKPRHTVEGQSRLDVTARGDLVPDSPRYASNGATGVITQESCYTMLLGL